MEIIKEAYLMLTIGGSFNKIRSTYLIIVVSSLPGFDICIHRSYVSEYNMNNGLIVITAPVKPKSNLKRLLLKIMSIRAGNNGQSSLRRRDFSQHFQPIRLKMPLKSLSSTDMTAHYFKP